MKAFNSVYFNSAWTYLTAGTPSLILQFSLANAVLLALFMFYRARKSKADYPTFRRQLQLLTVLANTIILFSGSLYPAFTNAIQPFKALLNQL